jgi:hypothetical protein
LNTPQVALEGIGLTSAARGVLREVLVLLRLATFQRVPGDEIQGRESVIALLCGVALAAWIVLEPLLLSRDLVFSWYAIPDLVCFGAGVFALAWILARSSRPAPTYRRALVITLGALPLAMVGEIASWSLVASSLQILYAAMSVYALWYFARGLRALTGRHQPLALLAGALFCATLIVALGYLQATPRLWTSAESRMDRLNAAGAEWVQMARAQFSQQARIDAAIAQLAPQDPSATEVYFLGFAGFGKEAIFAREIDLAARVVGERYGSAARSVRLVNDQRDIETWPIASEPGLRYALRRLGEVMGDEDVLFLTFASHGDRGKGVRVSNPGTLTTRLAPAAVEEMLREAGIQWRVVVVSACYSGTFADVLANDRSIVITAAGPDRKSFGCNDSRALTYFGEAFFRDALHSTASLRAAFQAASKALERKESDAGIVPSRPQASFGRLLEGKLDELVRTARQSAPAPQ